jgi:hypothetical protein
VQVQEVELRNGPYILVIAPEGYPGKKYRDRYVYEHHLVWWVNTGQTVPENKVVHHRNEDKHDNRFENLELTLRSSHSRDHHPPVTYIDLKCAFCGVGFKRDAKNYRSKAASGQKNFFCCRSHQVSHQHLNKTLW